MWLRFCVSEKLWVSALGPGKHTALLLTVQFGGRKSTKTPEWNKNEGEICWETLICGNHDNVFWENLKIKMWSWHARAINGCLAGAVWLCTWIFICVTVTLESGKYRHWWHHEGLVCTGLRPEVPQSSIFVDSWIAGEGWVCIWFIYSQPKKCFILKEECRVRSKVESQYRKKI